VNLRVEFDGGEHSETGIDSPSVAFTDAARNQALNQACRSVADPAAPELGRGCVYTINMQPTPRDQNGTLIDVRYGELAPTSSVAILPNVDAASPGAEIAPSLVVDSTLVVNGRDPYISPLAPEKVPPELEAIAPGITQDLQFGLAPGEVDRLTAMPGRATLRYELAPVGKEGTWRPLTVGTEAGRVSEVVVEKLLPGTSNIFSHELFAEGDTRAALAEGGEWANVSNFLVRGCFSAEFPQQGNAGDGNTADCRTFEVVLVRETPNSSSATSITFDREFTRSIGHGNRLSLNARLVSQNRLDTSGASSRLEGEVKVEGKLARSYSITVARAVGQATLSRNSAATGYEILVDAFGNRIYSMSDRNPNLVHKKEFSAAKSHSFPGLGFGFGPVRVGFRLGLGGEIRFDANDKLSLSNNAGQCATLLGTQGGLTTCGSISRGVTPSFNFTASVEGSIKVAIAKASVVADLDLVKTDFPLTASLAWGLGNDGRITVLGNANWKMGMQLVDGNASIVGRVGIRRFSRSLRVNLFNFNSQRQSETLFNRSMNGFEVLE